MADDAEMSGYDLNDPNNPNQQQQSSSKRRRPPHMPVDFTGYNPGPPILPPLAAVVGSASSTGGKIGQFDTRPPAATSTGDAWRAKIIAPSSEDDGGAGGRIDPALMRSQDVGGGGNGDKDEKRARLLREMEAMREALREKEREMSEL